MIRAVLYTRRDDPQAQTVLTLASRLREQVPHEVVVVHVDDDQALQARLGDLPLLQIGPYHLRPPFSETDLLVTLQAAQDRHTDRQRLGLTDATATPTDRLSRWIERGVWWIARHWLLVFNLAVFLFVALPFLAPVLMRVGLEPPARLLYRVYGLTCHQLAFRSWFLFGEQPAYPRSAAQVPGLTPFGQATGLDENDLLAARQFVGNPQIGYKVAICERDVAIYGSLLLFGLLYALFRRRIRPLPWYLWLLIGWVPIGLDGFSQLLSQIPGSPLPFRESTPLLRTLTGFLFGFTTAWFGYPLVEESMADTRALMAPRMQGKWATAREMEPAPQAPAPPTGSGPGGTPKAGTVPQETAHSPGAEPPSPPATTG